MEELYTEFAYDDAFRTMAVKCDDLLLPFLNYTFGEHYDSTACIVRGCNEHLIDRGMEVNEKRITDENNNFYFINNFNLKSYNDLKEKRENSNGNKINHKKISYRM